MLVVKNLFVCVLKIKLVCYYQVIPGKFLVIPSITVFDDGNGR